MLDCHQSRLDGGRNFEMPCGDDGGLNRAFFYLNLLIDHLQENNSDFTLISNIIPMQSITTQ